MSIAYTLVEESHGWEKHEREQKKDDYKGPQNIDIGNNTEAQIGQRLFLQLLLVTHVVLLLLFLLFLHFFAIDPYSLFSL